jgi:hypothetical protein
MHGGQRWALGREETISDLTTRERNAVRIRRGERPETTKRCSDLPLHLDPALTVLTAAPPAQCRPSQECLQCPTSERPQRPSTTTTTRPTTLPPPTQPRAPAPALTVRVSRGVSAFQR